MDLTPALEALSGSTLVHRVVRTAPPTSAEESAALQGIALGALLRTILVRRGQDDYLFVLVPGGRRLDWPKLRAHLGITRMSLPDAGEARAVTGYERGAITPFGSSRAWPVIADASVLVQPLVAIGAGARGLCTSVRPSWWSTLGRTLRTSPSRPERTAADDTDEPASAFSGRLGVPPG